jgi:hypothetical protein
MAIIAMNGAKWKSSMVENGFWRENPGTQKGENSRVRFLWDWTRDGLERMAIFLASRGQTMIHPEPARFFEVPVPRPYQN